MHQLSDYLKKFTADLFNELKSDETLGVNLHSEVSDFVRFNHSKVRQNTSVHQHEVTLTYQAQHKQYRATFNLSLDLKADLQFARLKLAEIRQQIQRIDESPKFTLLENHGVSEVIKRNDRPATSELMSQIADTFSDVDMVGFLSSGPLRQASINSKGQFHFFETDNYFFDYSIYNGPRAVKGYYAEPTYSENSFKSQAYKSKNTLSLLSKPIQEVKPGQHRAFLEPMAVAELMGMFYWRATSRNAYEQGFAPLKKLVTKEKSFSKKFSLVENNTLGFDSHFNFYGEKVLDQVPIIENGEYKNLLTSTATAKEFNLTSNFAEPSEMLRSPEVRAGTLEEKDVLQKLDTGLYLSNLHYINWSDPQAARITGMTRFACLWVENGEIRGPIQDLRFDDTLFNIWGDQLVDLTKNQQSFLSTSTYSRRDKGGMKVPGVLLNQFNFTL